MASRRSLIEAVLAVLLMAGVMHQAAAANIYRYLNDQGQMVWDSKVPPQFAKNGYTVLNERGVVIQVVPRALTKEELAAQESVLAAQRKAQDAEKAQKEADNLLIRLYRSPDDIARKRDDRVKQLETQLPAINASMAKVDAEIARLQTLVDNAKSAGREPSADLLSAIATQDAEKQRYTTQLERVQSDVVTTKADADRDIQRLSELLGTKNSTAQ